MQAHAGEAVPRETLLSLQASLGADAQAHFLLEKFDDARLRFEQTLAIARQLDAALSSRGVLQHNIASCLHRLGDFERARLQYQQALLTLERACASPSEPKPVAVLLTRMRFIRNRLKEVENGEMPDDSKYLDGSGTLREVNPLRLRTAWAMAEGRGGEGSARTTGEPGGAVARGPVYEDEEDVERFDADDDEAAQEAARKEWLEYYHRVGDWKRASDLIVTPEEYDDLEYLIDRARRQAAEERRDWDESLVPLGMGSRGGYATFMRARGVVQRDDIC